MANHLIFVPGLGDDSPHGQDKAIKLWRLNGLMVHYLALGWGRQEGFDKKLTRLLANIKELESEGHSLSLVGVSAGASAVINAFGKHKKLTAVICICGKINNPHTIGQRTYDRNPDFKQSVYSVQKSLHHLEQSERSRIMSIHPWADQTVPVKDTLIDGAKEKVMPGWSHISGIFFGVVFGGPVIAKFIKSGSH
jgi:hypothetical protein